MEFALVAPVLLLLVFGIIDFAGAYNSQSSLSAAARQGARVMAIQNSMPDAVAAAMASAPSLEPALSGDQVSIAPATCIPGATVTVTVTYPLRSISGFFTNVFGDRQLTGKAVMRCSG